MYPQLGPNTGCNKTHITYSNKPDLKIHLSLPLQYILHQCFPPPECTGINLKNKRQHHV